MDLGLAGKTALVTGGSRGIGKAIARQLALEGATVAIAARDQTMLAETALELTGETDHSVHPLVVDTGDDAAVRAMVAEAIRLLGQIDILVNCAARVGGPEPPLAEITDAAFYDDVNIKVMGYLRCIREVAPGMVERGWGRIINLSGLTTRQTGTMIGSMRNVAIAAMTKNLADELGPHGVHVIVVHPGITRTERLQAFIATQAQEAGASSEEIEGRFAALNTVKRLIDPREVADVVTFLASPRASAINGDAIAVGGGVPHAIHY